MAGSHQSDGHLLNDICDGTLLEDHNDPEIQIICYYDELSLTNPLMSRSKNHKIGMLCVL